MRSTLFGVTAALVAALYSSTSLAEAQQYKATLTAHAMVPAQSFLVPPADAPVMFNMSGRFTGGERTEIL